MVFGQVLGFLLRSRSVDQKIRLGKIHEGYWDDIKTIEKKRDENVQKAAENLTKERSLKVEKAR